MIKKNEKKLYIVIVIILFGFAAGATINIQGETGIISGITDLIISGNITAQNVHGIADSSKNESYSYLIWTDGTNYYAKNGSTGKIEYSGTNASIVFQNTINSLVPRGELRVRTGTYLISAPINIGSDKYIIGDGAEIGTNLVSTNQNIIFEINNSQNNVIKNIYFSGTNGKAIYASRTPGVGEAGNLLIENNNFGCDLQYGVAGNLIVSILYRNTFGYYGSCGAFFAPITINGSTGSWTANHNTIEKNRIIHSRGAPGLFITKATSVSILSNVFEQNQFIGDRGSAITVLGTSNIIIENNHIENNDGIGQILISDALDGSTSLSSIISNNYFTKNINNIAYLYPTRAQNYIDHNTFAGSDISIIIIDYIPRISSFEGNILIGGNISNTNNIFNHFDNPTNFSSAVNIVVNLSIPTAKGLSISGSMFFNTTSHTLNCYDGSWRYCGNGTVI